MRTNMIVAVLLASFAPTISAAQSVAPLPDAFKDDTKRHEHEVYDKFPDVKGTYAHGVSGGHVLADVDTTSEFCEGSAEERAALVKTYSAINVREYWFYGTSSQGVLFVKLTTPVLFGENRKKCSAAVWISYEIQRSYVANGFIHNFVLNENTVPGVGSFSVTRSGDEYSGYFMQLQSLMARPPLPTARRGHFLSRGKLAGEDVICTGIAGLVWHNVCYATRRPIRGMVLRGEAGDDERTMFENNVLEVRSNVRLQGAVFEVDRDWRLRDER